MLNVVLLLEKVLREKLPNDKYTLRVLSTKAGHLPNRAPFIRQVYRQTSLLEFVDDGFGETMPRGTLDIVYTVHARYLKEDEIVQLYDIIQNDLVDYLYSQR